MLYIHLKHDSFLQHTVHNKTNMKFYSQCCEASPATNSVESECVSRQDKIFCCVYVCGKVCQDRDIPCLQVREGSNLSVQHAREDSHAYYKTSKQPHMWIKMEHRFQIVKKRYLLHLMEKADFNTVK